VGDIPRDDGTLREFVQACARPLVPKFIKEDPKNGPHSGDTLSNFSPSDTSVTKVRERARQGAGLCSGDTLSNFSPSDTSVTKVRERARQGAGLYVGTSWGQEPVTGSFRAMPRNGPEEEGMTQACARPLVPKSIKDILRAE
jgi:hypothetical protein